MVEESRETVAAAAMAFDSLSRSVSSSVVTERTGDSNAGGGGGQEEGGGAAGGFYNGAGSRANSCSNSSSQSSTKIHEHDYIGSSSISVDKPEDRSGGAAAMAEDPDLCLGLRLGPPKNKEAGDGGESRLFQESAGVKLKLPSAGSKRGYAETVEAADLVKGMSSKVLPAMFPWSNIIANKNNASTNNTSTVNNTSNAANKSWRTIQDPPRTPFASFQRKDSRQSPESASLNHFSCLNHSSEDTPTSSGPMVGWPPVQSFRKNTLVAPAQTVKPAPELTPPDQGINVQAGNSLFVKVYMDGLPIGRKVDLDANNSYVKLSSALKDMFSGFVNGQTVSKQKSSGEVQSLFDGCETEYVLTYEDKDGDLMLVGDVPWRMFATNVKRLRIMKGSDAIGIGGPRETEATS